MTKKLTKDEIVALAQLARLQLSESEIEQYREELSAILGYVEQLGAVDTAGLEPTYQVSGLQSVMREDKASKQQATPEALLSLAPRKKDGYIQVGRMI